MNKVLDPLKERLDFLRHLTPAGLRKLADRRLNDLLVAEIPKAKQRILDLEQRYPTAGPRELAQRLVDGKKGLASMIGGISGIFGVISVPADLLVMSWLELTLLADIASLYKVNLKADRPRRQLLDLFFNSHGVGSIERAGPKVLGTVVGKLLEMGGLKAIGRAVPLVAAPMTAWLNNQAIQSAGESAIRHYEGFEKAHEKAKQARSRET